MTMQEATYSLLNQLRKIYSAGEADQITDWTMEHLTGSKKTERMMYKNTPITKKEEELLEAYTKRLLQHEPVQYVLNEAWFCGLKFYVDNNVLIPRPETEELVEWVINNHKNTGSELKILDIGTGSGCIPISLKRRLHKADVWACDISDDALKVADQNADSIGTEINFAQLDFLNKDNWEQLPLFDIIISNPPYIPENNKNQMASNVLQYEPGKALFVPDNNPLIFYTAIAEFGKTHLTKTGHIYVEIHEDLGPSTIEIFRTAGYKSVLKKDMQQKDRMIKSGLV